MKRFINFIKKLISSDSDVSSRRIGGLATLAVVLICALVDLFTGLQVSQFVYQGLLVLVLGFFSLTTITNFKQLSNDKAANDNESDK